MKQKVYQWTTRTKILLSCTQNIKMYVYYLRVKKQVISYFSCLKTFKETGLPGTLLSWGVSVASSVIPCLGLAMSPIFSQTGDAWHCADGWPLPPSSAPSLVFLLPLCPLYSVSCKWFFFYPSLKCWSSPWFFINLLFLFYTLFGLTSATSKVSITRGVIETN